MTAGVADLFAKLARLREALTAFTHQFIILVHLYSLTLQVDDAGKDIGSPVEQSASQHRRIDPFAGRILFGFVTRSGNLGLLAWGIDPRFGMMKGAARKTQEQIALGRERLLWRRVVANPISIVIDMGTPIDVLT